MNRTVFFHLMLAGTMLLAAARAGAAEPAKAGLRVWLDAADPATLVRQGGRLVKWADKSGQGHDALSLGDKSNPALVPVAIAGKPALRFNGKSDALAIAGPLRAAPGTVTLFIVSQRPAAQASDKKWQRLVASSDGSATPDNKVPNFCITATPNGEGKAYPPTVDSQELAGVALGTLTIGCSAGKGHGNFLAGDIAEILVYDRQFLSEGEIQPVLDYLKDKWGARLAREDRGWTRIGILENPPARVTDAAPLSDQANKGDWVKVEALSDEFEENKLDEAKWQPSLQYWKGRQPARFSPYNVTVSGGKMHLAMRKQPIPKELEAPGYKDYTSAAVCSKVKAGYGYYEVKARPMNSGGSSSFWFAHTGLPKQGTEIDVFEIGGKAPGFERKYNMNLHVFETPQEKRHWNVGGVWIAPWRLADDFHVYGLDWDEKEIKYYVDGVLVRRVNNTNWHFPMDLIFDSETMPSWFGMPKDEDLPSTYSVEYVRTWKHRGAQ